MTPAELELVRECAWEEIRKALEAAGHAKFAGRDWRALRSHGWAQVRQMALSKRLLNLVPGAKQVPLDELDIMVLEIVSSEMLADAATASSAAANADDDCKPTNEVSERRRFAYEQHSTIVEAHALARLQCCRQRCGGGDDGGKCAVYMQTRNRREFKNGE